MDPHPTPPLPEVVRHDPSPRLATRTASRPATEHDRHRLLARTEAAEVLACSPQTLAKWAHEGRGPAWIHVGRSVRYRLADLLDYLDARRVAPASPAKEGDHA